MMSYSFAVRGADAEEAKTAVAAQFDKIVAAQPIHEADRAEAQAVAETFIDKLASDAERDVQINVNGYVQTTEEQVTSICVGLTATLVTREQPA
jgi:hypothetical protein